MIIQIILSSVVGAVLFYFVYLLSLIKGFDWNSYETELAVALTVIAIGVLYWGFKPLLQRAGLKISEYDEKLEQRLVVKEDPYDQKAHLNTLNKIYQKLSVTRLSEQEDHTMVLEAIVNYADWKLSHGISKYMIVPYQTTELHWISVSGLEPDLARALSHLEQNIKHKNLLDLYRDLENQIIQYNKNIPTFVEYLESKIRQNMKEKTSYQEYFKENQDRGYHLDNIRKTVMLGLYLQLAQPESLSRFIDLELKTIRNVHVWFEDLDGGYSLLQVERDDEKPDIKQIQDLLFSMIKDEEILEKCRPHHGSYVKMIQANRGFCKHMGSLVDDIEQHGYAVQGKCDLGY